MNEKTSWRFGVVGNIVKEHSEDGITYLGTKPFPGGTKVYLAGKGWPGGNEISVIGLNRYKKYVLEDIPIKLIENLRIQTIHQPVILEIIDYLEHCEGWRWWRTTANDRREAEKFIDDWENQIQA